MISTTTSTILVVVTTLLLNSVSAQTTCPLSGGMGVYDDVCVACPPNTWAAGGNTNPCNDCPNGRACNVVDGGVTLCGYGMNSCDTEGNALSCLANYYLNSGDCPSCDPGTTSYNNNQLSSCTGTPTGDDDTPIIACSPSTDLCNNALGDSINCYAGNELIRKTCSPCTTNMQQPMNASIAKCLPCVEGQDTCTAIGKAIKCSANYYLDTASGNCLTCGAGSVSGPGNKDNRCTFMMLAINKYCPAATSMRDSVCAPCRRGSSSKAGVGNSCTWCGKGAKACDFAADGAKTITKCYSTYILTNNACIPTQCGVNTFLINKKCHKCPGTKFNPPNNQLPVCQRCRKGTNTCTYTAATTCNPKYVLKNGRCHARNLYDCLDGYTVIESIKIMAIKRVKNVTPPQCLVACEQTKGCRSFHAATNGLQQAGLCTLYAKVLQITDITPYGTFTSIVKVFPRAIAAPIAAAKKVKALVSKAVTKIVAKVKTAIKSTSAKVPATKSKAKVAAKVATVGAVSKIAKIKTATTKSTTKDTTVYSMHIILNRQSRKSAQKSILGLPASAKVCSTLTGDCFAIL